MDGVNWKQGSMWAALIGFVCGLAGVAFGLVGPGPSESSQLSPDGTAATLPEPRFRAKNPKAFLPKALSQRLTANMEAEATRYRELGHGEFGLPAGEIDYRRGQVVGNEWVQRLPDGTDLAFTLNPKLHEKALRILKYYRVEYGVLIAMNPQNGEILALGEHARNRPHLRHLALQAEGPAASIFKIVSSAALLEHGKLKPEDTICTHGGRRRLSLRLLKDHPKRDKECGTFAKALGTSNNVAFARWADRNITPSVLQSVAEKFAFNQRLPFLHGVAMSRAKIPTASRLGFAKSAAGFVGTTLSPLHAVSLISAIGNGGEMMVPRLIREARVRGQTLYQVKHESLKRVVSPRTAKQLIGMMTETTKPAGSAGLFFNRRRRGVTKPRLQNLTVSGKTGSLASRHAGVSKSYSWFVAVAPAEKPTIAVAALVVNGQVWSTKGATIARDLLEHWQKLQVTKKTPARKDAVRSKKSRKLRAQPSDSVKRRPQIRRPKARRAFPKKRSAGAGREHRSRPKGARPTPQKRRSASSSPGR